MFHSSQIWYQFQSHGMFKNCLLDSHSVYLFTSDPEVLCFQYFLRSILINECRRSSLAVRYIFLVGRIAIWLRGGVFKQENRSERCVSSPLLCTGLLAISSECAQICTSPAPWAVMSKNLRRTKLVLHLLKLSGRCCKSSALLLRYFLQVKQLHSSLTGVVLATLRSDDTCAVRCECCQM